MQSNRPTSARETPYVKTYANGKIRGIPAKDRLLRRITLAGECWIWDGAKRPNGYGLIGINQDGRNIVKSTHRVSYEVHIGPIPDGAHIDHLCSVRSCVNPAHLRAVTQAANNQAVWDRGERAKVTHCKWGHEYTPENTAHHSTDKGSRQCRE